MVVVEKKFLRIKTSELIPYENNPRIIPAEAVSACAESMRQCAPLDPIEVDEDYVILSGHTRRLALIKLGIDETDVIQYIGLSEEQKRKYRLLANKTAELSTWDIALLEGEVQAVDFGEFDFGFEMLDASDFIGDLLENDFGNKILDREEFSLTLTIPTKYEDDVRGFIKGYGKAPMIDAVLKLACPESEVE